MQPRFAARLNSFASRPELFWSEGVRPGTLQCLERAATVEGLEVVDLNYPDHLSGIPPEELPGQLGAWAWR